MDREELEKRRAERERAHAESYDEQRTIDLEHIDALEEEHGHGRVVAIALRGWRPGGAVTTMAFRLPVASEASFKRFQQVANSDKAPTAAKVEAAEMLGAACVVYPDRKTDKAAYDATVELAPGVLGHAANEIVIAIQGDAEREGK
jgi:hypothetical protein